VDTDDSDGPSPPQRRRLEHFPEIAQRFSKRLALQTVQDSGPEFSADEPEETKALASSSNSTPSDSISPIEVPRRAHVLDMLDPLTFGSPSALFQWQTAVSPQRTPTNGDTSITGWIDGSFTT